MNLLIIIGKTFFQTKEKLQRIRKMSVCFRCKPSTQVEGRRTMKEFIKNKTKIDESYDVLKMFSRQMKFKLS